MAGFNDPLTLALLGAGSGFLDPRGGMLGGFHGAMQGLQAGYGIQDREEERKLKQQDALQRIQAQDFLQKHQQEGTDPRTLIPQMVLSGNQHLANLAATMQKSLPTVKSTVKGFDAQGNPVFHNVMNTGEVSSTGITPAEQAMQVNQGSQISFIDPFSLKPRGQSMAVGMAPGEQARLAQSYAQMGQSAQQHADTMGMQRERLSFDKGQKGKPQLVNGSWVYPPTADNPQGMVIPTDMTTAPKGSQAEKAVMAKRIENTLGDDTEELIKAATGSYLGAGRDLAASLVGVTTDPAEANATLKLRAATLAGNMPRFEGPQSDADRAYYLEMAGDLANPTKTDKQKLAALKELKRINGLVDNSGSVKGNAAPVANQKRSAITRGGFSAVRND